MRAYERGLYEELISEALEQELGNLPVGLLPDRGPLRRAEAGDRLALFLARIVERAVNDVPEKERVARGLTLARALVATLASELDRDDLRQEVPASVSRVDVVERKPRVLEHRAREIVLDSIRRSIPSQWTGRRLASIEARGPEEETLRRACGRLLHVDDRERLETYRQMLQAPAAPPIGDVASCSTRLLRMLIASVCDRAVTKDDSLETGIALLWQHPQVRSELVELFTLLADRIDHRHYEIGETHPEVPLRIHARYSRLEILAAFQPAPRAKVPPWQTGVQWVPEGRADLFAFTLDKTSGQFSPTTRYRDYAISSELIHWESQSATWADSDTGRRYQEHVRAGTSVMLFARKRADERAFWFLGSATYVRHQGERPMAIVWRLRHPLPGDLYASFAAAVA